MYSPAGPERLSKGLLGPPLVELSNQRRVATHRGPARPQENQGSNRHLRGYTGHPLSSLDCLSKPTPPQRQGVSFSLGLLADRGKSSDESSSPELCTARKQQGKRQTDGPSNGTDKPETGHITPSAGWSPRVYRPQQMTPVALGW